MGIGRRLFLVWLLFSIIWLALVGAFLRTGGWWPGKWEVFYTLRDGIGEPPDTPYGLNTPLPRPLYEIIRSPSQEKLPVVFQPRGWQSRSEWDYRLNIGQWEPRQFPDGSKLWLQPALSEDDKNYIAEVFWAERWSRWARLLQPWLSTALIPLLGLWLALWSLRLLAALVKGKPGRAGKKS